MATDRNGAKLYPGDEVAMYARVTDVTNDHVLTVALDPPHREYWFMGTMVARVSQGAASKDADKREAAANAVPSPEPAPATTAPTPVEPATPATAPSPDAGTAAATEAPAPTAQPTAEDTGIKAETLGTA